MPPSGVALWVDDWVPAGALTGQHNAEKGASKWSQMESSVSIGRVLAQLCCSFCNDLLTIKPFIYLRSISKKNVKGDFFFLNFGHHEIYFRISCLFAQLCSSTALIKKI